MKNYNKNRKKSQKIKRKFKNYLRKIIHLKKEKKRPIF